MKSRTLTTLVTLATPIILLSSLESCTRRHKPIVYNQQPQQPVYIQPQPAPPQPEPQPEQPQYEIEDAERNPKVIFRGNNPLFQGLDSRNFTLTPRAKFGQFEGRQATYNGNDEIWASILFTSREQIQAFKGVTIRAELYGSDNKFLSNGAQTVGDFIPIPTLRIDPAYIEQMGYRGKPCKVLYKANGVPMCLMFFRSD